jgi:hypothetical protein
MGQGVAILVVFASEALGVVLASRDWALLRPFRLVSEHVCLEIFEDAATVRVWATALLVDLIIGFNAAQCGAALGAAGLDRRDG